MECSSKKDIETESGNKRVSCEHVIFPNDIDLDRIHYVLERIRERRDEDESFWIERVDNKFSYIVAGISSNKDDSSLVTETSVIHDIERFVQWLKIIPCLEKRA